MPPHPHSCCPSWGTGRCWKGDTGLDDGLGLFWGGVGSAGGLSSQGRVKVRTLRLPPAHPALGCHPELRLLPASSSHVRLGKDLSRAGKAARGQRGDSVGEGRMAWGWSDLLPPQSPPGSGAPTAGGCQERHQLPQGSPTQHQEQVPELLLPWDLQYWEPCSFPGPEDAPFPTAASGSQFPGPDA